VIPHWKGKPGLGGPWDFFRLDGKRLPGRVASLDVTGSTAVSNVKSKGVNGPSQKSEGYDGATLTLVLEVYTSAQCDEIDAAFEPLRVTNPGSETTPRRVDHPIAFFHRVEFISSASVSTGMPSNGRWQITVSMIQWFPPEEKSKANGAGKPGAGAGGDGGPLPDTSVPTPDPANLGGDFP